MSAIGAKQPLAWPGGMTASDPKRTFDRVLFRHRGDGGIDRATNLTANEGKSSHSVKGLDLDATEHRTFFIRNFDRVAGQIMHRAGIGSS